MRHTNSWKIYIWYYIQIFLKITDIRRGQRQFQNGPKFWSIHGCLDALFFSMLKQTTKSIKKWLDQKRAVPFWMLNSSNPCATLWTCVYILSACVRIRDCFEDVKNADKVILMPKNGIKLVFPTKILDLVFDLSKTEPL